MQFTLFSVKRNFGCVASYLIFGFFPLQENKTRYIYISYLICRTSVLAKEDFSFHHFPQPNNVDMKTCHFDTIKLPKLRGVSTSD